MALRNIYSLGLGQLDIKKIIIFIVWPFYALIISLKDYNKRGAATLFFLFCVYFGFVFIVQKDIETAGDNARYAARLAEYHFYNYDLHSLINSLYLEGGLLDLYAPIVTWFVAQFTDSSRYLFLIFALVFGYFYSKNIWLVLEQRKSELNWVTFMFLVSIVLMNPIWNINGVRMWTAAHVYLFGILLYFLKNEKKGVFYIIGSIFFHFSFLAPVFVLIAFINITSISKRLNLLFYIYIFTLFINEINLSLIRNLLLSIPFSDIFFDKITGFTDEDYAARIGSLSANYNLRKSMAILLGKNIIYLWLILLFYFRSLLMKNKKLYVLFAFTLFFGSIANILSLVPSGFRFLLIVNTLVYIISFLILTSSSIRITKLYYFAKLSFPILLYLAIYKLRISFEVAGWQTYLGNPILALLFEPTTPLIETIKNLLR